MKDVVDQITGNSQNTDRFSSVTQQYKLNHKELDTSFRLSEFENSMADIVREQLQKENEKAVKQGKAVSSVAKVNNFENDAQTKFYKEQLEELVGDINNMSVEQIKVQQKRMEHLMDSLEDSTAIEKDFLIKQMEQSQDFIKDELEQKNKLRTRVGNKIEEALDNYGQIESLALGLVDNNPIAAVGVRMLTSWYKKNREDKKNTKKQVESDEHRTQMMLKNEEDKKRDQDEEAKNNEKLRELQETELAKQSRFSRRRNDEIKEENEQAVKQSEEDEYTKWNGDDRPNLNNDESKNQQISKFIANEDNNPNVADEVRTQQASKSEQQAEQNYYSDSKKHQKASLKLFKRIDKKTILIEKHLGKLLKKEFGGKGGLSLGVGGMGNMLAKAGPALAIAGAAAAGWMIGEGINKIVQDTTGDSVGGNIFNIVNGTGERDKDQKSKDEELGIDGLDIAVGNSVMNNLDDEGIIDFNKIGDSEIEDWKKVEALDVFKLRSIYSYGDFDKDDMKRLERIILKKNAEQKVKMAEGIKRRAERNKKLIESKANRNNQENFTGVSSKELGGISAKYETGGGGAGTISSGDGDPGGISYGTYQLSSNAGTLQKYVKQSKYKDQLGGKINSQEFQDNWKKIAKENPDFAKEQQDFIKKTHYNPVQNDFKKQSSLENLKNMPGLQDALWSISVQHSGKGASEIIKNALANVNEGATEEEYINALYKARGEYTDKVASNNNNPKEKAQLYGLKKGRYAKERLDALKLAKNGRGETQLAGSVDAKENLEPTKPSSEKLTAQIDSTKAQIDKQNQESKPSPNINIPAFANNSGGGGGGGGSSPAPSSARNNESSNQRITDRYISNSWS